MILIEFREAALNRAFDELEEAKANMKNAKMALCNVEDALCDLQESHDKESEGEYTEADPYFDTTVSGNDIEVNYRGRRGMRMRSQGGMRRGMRMRYSDRYTY